MHFGHKKKHDEQETHDTQATEQPKVCKLHLVCGLRHECDGDEHVTCRIEEVAVPEVETGIVETCEELEDEECSVYYETAVPEIHVGGGLLHCPAVNADEK